MRVKPVRVFIVDHLESDQKRTMSSFGTCDVCGSPTRENKPYCPAHISNIPYVAKLLIEVERREGAVASVVEHGWKAVNIN
ncbi:unnamed protein product, partial [marine sediment metagenome]